MADVKISALGAISVVAGEDLVAIIDDPSGTPASRKATITQLATFINTGAITAGSTTTFTAKTIDADNNTLSNIEVDNFKSGVLDTDLSSVSGSDDTIASAKAVKAYVDAQILTEDTLTELNDTTITSVGDNELLQYDSTSSKWINQTIAEAGLSPVAGSSSIVTTGTITSGEWQGTVIASAYIAGDAIVGSKIADNAINSEHYTDGSIDLAHMSVNSIDSDQYVDASIDLAHLASDSVNGTKIADDSINSEHIVDGSVDLAHLSVNSVDSDQYVDGSIDLIHLSANSVDSDQYVDGSIDLIHLSANSVDSDQYVDGSIDLAHLSADSVDGSKIVDDAINSEHYTNASIDLAHMSVNSIDSDQYVDGSIDRAHLSADIIDATKIADDAVTSDHLAGTLTLTGTTTTAGIDVAGNNIDNVQNIIHDISTTGLDIDFSEDELQTYSVSGNVTFTTFQNITAGKSKTIRVTADGTARVLTFPSGIRWLGTAPSSNTYTVTASKMAILTFTSFSTDEANILGVFALEE